MSELPIRPLADYVLLMETQSYVAEVLFRRMQENAWDFAITYAIIVWVVVSIAFVCTGSGVLLFFSLGGPWVAFRSAIRMMRAMNNGQRTV